MDRKNLQKANRIINELEKLERKLKALELGGKEEGSPSLISVTIRFYEYPCWKDSNIELEENDHPIFKAFLKDKIVKKIGELNIELQSC